MKTILRSITRIAAVLIAASVHLAAAATEKLVYFHNDLAGTPIAATDSFGNLLWQQSYKPYGERLDPKAPAKDTPWFSDKAYVEGAGLSYFGARWYDPQLGRFMGIDPKGFDEASVLSFNRYSYANDNPYRYIDPDGRQVILINPVTTGGGAIATLPTRPLGKPSEAQQIRQLEGFGSTSGLPTMALPTSVPIGEILSLVVLGGAPSVVQGLNAILNSSTPDNDKDRSLGANPFRGKSAQEVSEMLGGRGFVPKGPDPVAGQGTFVNPETGRGYHIDANHGQPKGPHVGVHRPRDQRDTMAPRDYPMGRAND